MAALRIRSRKRRTAEMTLGAGASEGLLPLSQRVEGSDSRGPEGQMVIGFDLRDSLL